MFAGGRSHPFTGPLDLLRFSPLSLRSRLRMGWATVRLQRAGAGLDAYEDRTARDWIESNMGREAWEVVWGPLLRGKFGDRADDISMAWLWSKLTLRRQIKGQEARRELLGYPRGGWQPLLERLRDEIIGRGGRVLENRPAKRLGWDDGALTVEAGAADSFRAGHEPATFAPGGEAEGYDAVLATVPSDVFAALLSDRLAAAVGRDYLGRVKAAEYHAAVCLLIELDRPFGRYYWTNIADADIPFVGLIEHTNFVEPERYGGRRLLYVANYVARDDPILELDADALLTHYELGLRRVNPEFDRGWVRRLWLHREPAAQPIVTVGYSRRMPPLETGVPGLVLANTTQIYPEDRGTNYSVRLGTRAAALISGGAG
jgi:protoporphyrinogen oxidase